MFACSAQPTWPLSCRQYQLGGGINSHRARYWLQRLASECRARRCPIPAAAEAPFLGRCGSTACRICKEIEKMLASMRIDCQAGHIKKESIGHGSKRAVLVGKPAGSELWGRLKQEMWRDMARPAASRPR